MPGGLCRRDVLAVGANERGTELNLLTRRRLRLLQAIRDGRVVRDDDGLPRVVDPRLRTPRPPAYNITPEGKNVLAEREHRTAA